MAASLWLAAAVPLPVVDGWAQIAPSLATIEGSGVACLIDERGLFLAHASVLPRSPVFAARLKTGPAALRVISEDSETGLVLLEAIPPFRSPGPPFKLAPRGPIDGQKLILGTAAGPRVGLASAQARIGQLRPSLRYVPLQEVKMEQGPAPLVGSPAFDSQGRLVGMIGALTALPPGPELMPTRLVGPNDLAVGFAYGPSLLHRVVEGFRSPERIVKHPSIGVFFKFGGVPGATIEAVMPDSPAAKAGIQVGDVVVEADGARIASPVEFAATLFNA
ncbi:MAG: S1C family serine protease, partial [Fimbriimonadaceae bacterium]|nr:S1C family serine protease [Fimbriimonadaceae bacterium]